MLSGCVKTVGGVFTSIVQTPGLYKRSTETKQYLASQVLFMDSLYRVYALVFCTTKQLADEVLDLLSGYLYTLSTTPTNTNKLYKGFYL